MAKSIRQQIIDLEAKVSKINGDIAELQKKLDSEVDHSKVQAGRTITFVYGSKKVVMTGIVLGRKDPAPGEKGAAIVRVAVGEGFEAQIVSTYPQAVTAIEPTEEELSLKQAATAPGTVPNQD